MKRQANRRGPKGQDDWVQWGVGKMPRSLKNRFVGRCKMAGVKVHEALAALVRSPEAMQLLFDKIIPNDEEIKRRRNVERTKRQN